METVLVILHTEEDGSLAKPAREALQAARMLAGQGAAERVVCGLMGGQVQEAAGYAAGAGAAQVLTVEGEDFATPRYATDAAAAEAIILAASPSLILAPGSSRLHRALPGAAWRVKAKVDSHIVGLAGNGESVTATRWYYRQRMEAQFTREARPWMLLLEPGAFPAWEGEAAAAVVTPVAVPLSDAHRRTTFVGVEALKGEQQTIRPEAPLLLVAGAGWTKKQKDGQVHIEEAARLILDFVEATQCSLGSSKSLVDLKSEGGAVLPFLTHLHQVGQTGTTPRHPKGLATCCHGEEPHVVGWRLIHERRAINLDANCGWARGKADVLYVADAFAVLRELNALLAAR